MFRKLTNALDAPRWSSLCFALLLVACGPSDSDSAGLNDAAGPTTSGDACVTPEVALPDGSCIRPGIPSNGCSEGFEHDGEYGCDPILPDDDCAPGMMAVPGDTACRPVMPCGQGKWGDLPVDADTQYVDGGYQGNDSDGTSARPWVTINDAYQAAAAHDLLAVSEGRYQEQLVVEAKPIRLWGVCPEKVSLIGTSSSRSTIAIYGGGDGTEIGGLAIASAAIGMEVSGALNVTLDRLWVHDTAQPGIAFMKGMLPASGRITGSLVEGSGTIGVFVLGSEVSLRSSVVRYTRARLEDQAHGVGVDLRPVCDVTGCMETSRPQLTIEGSLIDGNHSQGVFAMGGDLSMKASVVRNTAPQPADHRLGQGLRIVAACDTLERCNADQPTRATIEGSLISDNRTAGIAVLASQLSLDRSVIRDTQSRALDKQWGLGIMVQSVCDSLSCTEELGSEATLRHSLIEGSRAAGVVVDGSKATLEQVVARHTSLQERDFKQGSGIIAQSSCNDLGGCDKRLRGDLTVVECLISDSHVAGIKVIGSHATLSSTVVEKTSPATTGAPFGDGVLFVSYQLPATGTIDALTIRDSSRAGIANFGADISIKGSHIACAAFELAGEPFEEAPFRFDNGGDNICGCPEPSTTCKAVSAGLEPPRLGSF